MLRQIILDTETTGLDPKAGHRVIEIGCIELVNRKFTGEQFHVYLNPDRDSDEGALEVHGLTTEFLSDKPRFGEIYEDFLAFVDDSELLIHNAEFDVNFINHEISLLSKKLPKLDESVYKITDTLVKRYEVSGYDRELHGALLDSQILGDVYLSMTGGQSAIDFSDNMTSKASEEDISDKTSNQTYKLKVIELSEEEKKLHEDYLSRMKEETGVDPLAMN